MTKNYLAEFEAANPDIAQWWNTSIWDFAQSLKSQVAKGRPLSERQLQVARESIARSKPTPPVAAPAPQQVNVDLIEHSFARAKGSLLNPKMRLLSDKGNTYTVSMAPAYGKNAGSLYVKGGDTYMGKITNGTFYPDRHACSEAEANEIVAVCSKPEVSAIAYGQRYGNCSVCDRTLTNPLSIELGIGPVCRGRFFG